MRRVILVTLICGIMPGLMGLSHYGNNSNKVYAVKLSIDNISTMQEMRPGICHNMNIGDAATLTDTRDESTYTIAKLSDGKCWMTQNLRIVNYTTKADDSQTGGYTIPASSTSGFSDNAASNAYYGNNATYGAYYTWCAATAGTCSSATTDKAEATGSICPKGWRLPKSGTGTGTNDFANMAGIPTTTNITKDNNFWSSVPTKSFASSTLTLRDSAWPAAGYYYNSSPSDVGSYGYYWSSTAGNSTNAYRLDFGSSNFYPASTRGRYFGFPVRCVADSYAEEDVNVVAVKVAPTISIDASTGARVEVDPNVVSVDGTITATISANTTYDVLLSADEPNLVSTTDITKYIPASSNIAIRTNGWGIKNNDNTYSAITTSPTTYYNTSSYDETKQQTLHTFSLGISIAPSLPSGTYSTTVTVTAVNN